ncbi:MAG: hypothetical protein KKB37_13410 [Alphaproteobacteria bacterium]|nr:hypothetical protein [Alphaproteobacteria bacterium]
MTDFIIVGLEYNYIDLDSETHNIRDTDPQGGVERVVVDPDAISTLTARLSLKF